MLWSPTFHLGLDPLVATRRIGQPHKDLGLSLCKTLFWWQRDTKRNTTSLPGPPKKDTCDSSYACENFEKEPAPELDKFIQQMMPKGAY